MNFEQKNAYYTIGFIDGMARLEDFIRNEMKLPSTEYEDQIAEKINDIKADELIFTEEELQEYK